ncbi:MAG TPA: hypothetical protein VJA27_03495 [Patescibacteria group bacterium]|nr:hypothetical protein [Patescibacteria group bacterium]
MSVSSIKTKTAELRKSLLPLTYEQIGELKSKLEDLKKEVGENTALQNIKDAVDGLSTIAEAVQKEVEHLIWVRSRDASEEEAAELVPEIPDAIVAKLATAPLHNGAPRALLQTKAFQERLKKLQS